MSVNDILCATGPDTAAWLASCAQNTFTPGPTNTITQTFTITLTPTITSTPTSVAFISGGTCNETCTDSGDASPGSLTITPVCSLILLTVSDTDGCNVSLSESGAANGRFVWIQNITSNYARFATQAGVLFLPHEFHYIMEGHAFVIDYKNSQWYQVGGNDPSSVMLSLKEITGAGDVPSVLPPANECAILCAPTLSGSALSVISSIGGRDLMAQTDPCTCTSTGSGAVSVGPSGTCSAAGNTSICIGDGITVDGTAIVRIGNTSASSTWDMTGDENISIGVVNTTTGDMNGTQSVQIGWHPISQDGDNSICIGSSTICDQDFGICYGSGCVNQDHDFTVGSDTEPLHPVWPGDPPTPSACGTNPAVSSDSNDVVGEITVGSGGGVTTCTLTFARTWAKEPSCFVENESQILLMRVVTTTSTMVIDTAGDLTDDVIKYGCPLSPE